MPNDAMEVEGEDDRLNYLKAPQIQNFYLVLVPVFWQ